ncbi:MAG: hypothetical protein V2A69_14485 [Pseudomonadota bacterium]
MYFESLRVVFPAACGEFVIPAEAGIQGIYYPAACGGVVDL